MYVPGQIILYKDGPNIISKLIRFIQGNKLAHCAFIEYLFYIWVSQTPTL